ncbi:predicted protein [Sclerotinia sclerotiorum 1980 UF-70]|uniref:Uncharacterized protein n=1 Tax=Sclerotinia sclerotiorum (strain ATCC 18683 / 1980 / Ss-1) TaxID=665079 RepID=A7E816_SCLS1|nr:predicted protein [Sclerotinia sclerotiorum 1980 UF-70]EDN96518.1 predicted protein [Sclerotinia sclerotiorum 1980 UF-70]
MSLGSNYVRDMEIGNDTVVPSLKLLLDLIVPSKTSDRCLGLTINLAAYLKMMGS